MAIVVACGIGFSLAIISMIYCVGANRALSNMAEKAPTDKLRNLIYVDQNRYFMGVIYSVVALALMTIGGLIAMVTQIRDSGGSLIG